MDPRSHRYADRILYRQSRTDNPDIESSGRKRYRRLHFSPHRIVPKIFVGVAFDSGGVASGPMTITFLLPLSIGVCEAVGGNIMTDAFGVVALVALTPLIAIQIMGLVYKHKTTKMQENIKEHDTDPTGSEDIIDFEEDI